MSTIQTQKTQITKKWKRCEKTERNSLQMIIIYRQILIYKFIHYCYHLHTNNTLTTVFLLCTNIYGKGRQQGQTKPNRHMVSLSECASMYNWKRDNQQMQHGKCFNSTNVFIHVLWQSIWHFVNCLCEPNWNTHASTHTNGLFSEEWMREHLMMNTCV